MVDNERSWHADYGTTIVTPMIVNGGTDAQRGDDSGLTTTSPGNDWRSRTDDRGAGCCGILRHQQALWISAQTGLKRRSKILELEKLQDQSILTIKQFTYVGFDIDSEGYRDTQTPGHRWFHHGPT